MEKYHTFDNFDLEERKYEIVVFDLDGTLAKSKQAIDKEIINLILNLLKYKKVVIISGGNFLQFKKQIINQFPLLSSPYFKNLYLFPNSGSSFFLYKNFSWQNIYSLNLNKKEKEIIISAIKKSLKIGQIDLPKKSFGKIIEDRDSEITFSALGMNAPIELKEKWDIDHKKRIILKKILDKMLSQFSVKIGGSTSLDITKKNIDKNYAIKFLMNYLQVSKDKILYIGDALFKGGNDESVLKLSIDSIIVKDINETNKIISDILKQIEINKKNLVSPITEYRPWGKMREFERNQKVSTKIIEVKKGEELSLQTHKNRSEFWRILKGNPKIKIGDKIYKSKKRDEFFIDKEVQHQIIAENKDAEVLEISKGNFQDEDIVRIKDKYER